jgi:hypothetical protein
VTCREGPLSPSAGAGAWRVIARSFGEAGAPADEIARTGPSLAELATTSANIRTEVAAAANATVAWSNKQPT